MKNSNKGWFQTFFKNKIFNLFGTNNFETNQRSLKFPGLFSGCTMDWFTRWPKDALIAVSSHFLKKFPLVCPDDTKDAIIEAMGCVHDCVQETCLEYFERFRRTTHVTPKSYLSFLEGYTGIYKLNLEHLEHLASRMKTGLDKLMEAGESVDQLSKELAVKKVCNNNLLRNIFGICYVFYNFA